MKNNDDIPTTDATEIKQLINHVKQGKLDQGDALLIEKLRCAGHQHGLEQWGISRNSRNFGEALLARKR